MADLQHLIVGTWRQKDDSFPFSPQNEMWLVIISNSYMWVVVLIVKLQWISYGEEIQPTAGAEFFNTWLSITCREMDHFCASHPKYDIYLPQWGNYVVVDAWKNSARCRRWNFQHLIFHILQGERSFLYLPPKKWYLLGNCLKWLSLLLKRQWIFYWHNSLPATRNWNC